MKKNSRNENILILAIPVIIQEVSLMLLQLTDIAMVGHIGEVAIAAIAINTAPIWLFNNIASALGTGANAIIARTLGTKDKEKAQNYSSTILFLSGILGLFVSILFVCCGNTISHLMGAEAHVLPYAGQYLRIIGISYVFKYITVMLGAIFRSYGDFKTPMIINVLTGLLNIICNLVFIYEPRDVFILGNRLTMPGLGLGVSGAAIATTIASITGCIMLYICLNKKSIVDIKLKAIKGQLKTTKTIFQISAPVLIEKIITTIGQTIFLRLVATMGTTIVAANSLALSIEAISYTPAYGFSAVAATLTASALGEGNVNKAKKQSKKAFQYGCIYMSFIASLFIIAPSFFLNLFTNSETVITNAIPLVRMLAIMQPFFCSTIILGGTLNGAGDTKYVMNIAMLSKGAIRIITSILMVVLLHGGIIGAWISMTIDQCLQGCLIFARYKSLKWAKVGKIESDESVSSSV